jgi:hypothetical protein
MSTVGEKRTWPLCCGLFIYDTIRVIVIVGALIIAALGRQAGGQYEPPLLMYAAPNALFPLAALFLWLRPETYRPCIPLYVAGKIAAAAAAAYWLLLTTNGMASFYSALSMRSLYVLAAPASTVMLLLFDSISILAALKILRGAGNEEA